MRRPFSFLRHSAVAVLLWTIALAGCALHLHDPTAAKQANAALENYEKINRNDAVIARARKNSTELSKAEREAIVRVTETLVAGDLAALLTVQDGWERLERETRDVLGPLGVLDGSQLKLKAEARRAYNRLARLDDQPDAVRDQRERLGVFIRRYRRGTPPGRQATRCDYQPAPEDVADQIPTPAQMATRIPPESEPETAWKVYTDFVVPACAIVLQEEEKADPAALLVGHPEFKALTDRIKELDAKVRAAVVEARVLEERLAAETKALAAAQAELTQRTAEKQTAEVAAKVDQLQKDVKKSAETINAILKETQRVPLAATLAKQEILQTLLVNLRALGGSDEPAANEVTRRLLVALKTYPDVAGPLRAADKPPVNVLLLELAVQRLEYQRLNAEVRADADRLKILRDQQEAWMQRAKNWMDVVKAMEQVPAGDVPRTESIIGKYRTATNKPALAAVIDAYAETRLRYDVTVAALAFDDDDRRRMLRFDLSEVALTAWKDFIRAPLQEVAAYRNGGLKSEDIANLIRALGLGGIAVGTNR